MPKSEASVIVVGAGPNGLSAGLRLAELGRSVLVVEGAETIGGGTRSVELTRTGYLHDVCSTVHPLALVSPFFRRLNLEQQGIRWVHPTIPLAHPLDDGTAVLLQRSAEATARQLGKDARVYCDLVQPFLRRGIDLYEDLLAPIHFPRHIGAYARFGWLGLASVRGLTRRFQGEPARALFAGLAAHSMLPLEAPLTAAVGLVLALAAHLVGWPFVEGGSRRITDSLAKMLRAYGGGIETGTWIKDLGTFSESELVLLDVTPIQALDLAGERFSFGFRRQLRRYRYGPGIFKIDYALDAPIPWQSRYCHQAGTLHLGGTFEEIAHAEQQVWDGEHPERPFVLLTQPTLFDPSRAPSGKHIAWAYCHVPHGSTVDMTSAIEAQIERFAPGFQDRVLARHTMTAAGMQAYNPNYVGGDINGGVLDWRQFLTRPTLRRVPYATSDEGIYLCSSATPPGGGVHGMSGYYAAEVAFKRSLQ